MATFDIILILIFATGIGLILYLIFRDPVLMLRSFLRALKSDGSYRLMILLFPIWGPAWLIDKIFGFKIYAESFEEASKERTIPYDDYEKYVIINTDNVKSVNKYIDSFNADYDSKDFDYSLNGAVIKTATLNSDTVMQLDSKVPFKSYKMLISYLDNSAPKNKVFNVRGVLISKNRNAKSLSFVRNVAYPGKLVGKDQRNRKLYLDFLSNNSDKTVIYYNPDIDYIRKFNFRRFENEVARLRFGA